MLVSRNRPSRSRYPLVRHHKSAKLNRTHGRVSSLRPCFSPSRAAFSPKTLVLRENPTPGSREILHFAASDWPGAEAVAAPIAS